MRLVPDAAFERIELATVSAGRTPRHIDTIDGWQRAERFDLDDARTSAARVR